MSSSMTSIALFLMSLKKRLFACFSSERFTLFELGNALFAHKRCYTIAEGPHMLDAMMQAYISPSLLRSNEQ